MPALCRTTLELKAALNRTAATEKHSHLLAAARCGCRGDNGQPDCFVHVYCSSQPLPPCFSAREFRDALGMFATGVTIVTARSADGTLTGLTASSFNSVSLTPPLVLWSLAHKSASRPVLTAGSHYTINVLAASQKHLAERFAARDVDRWQGVAYTLGRSGAPLLEGAVATFECFNRSRHDEGDHVIFVGEVECCTHHAGVPPLLYHGGRFYTEHPL